MRIGFASLHSSFFQFDCRLLLLSGALLFLSGCDRFSQLVRNEESKVSSASQDEGALSLNPSMKKEDDKREEYDIVRPFSHGLAAVNIGAKFTRDSVSMDSGKWGYVDKNFVLKIPLRYIMAREFSEGLAGVECPDGKCGFIDTAGNLVIELPRYTGLGYFSEGLAPISVSRDGRSETDYIDAFGRVRLSIPGTGSEFHEGLALFRPNENKLLAGYIDQQGKIVIKPTYRYARVFTEGVAAVCIAHDETDQGRDKWGFIDKTGRLVIDAVFCEADVFSDGVAFVRIDGSLRHIAHDHNPIKRWVSSSGAFFIDHFGTRICESDTDIPLSRPHSGWSQSIVQEGPLSDD